MEVLLLGGIVFMVEWTQYGGVTVRRHSIHGRVDTMWRCGHNMEVLLLGLLGGIVLMVEWTQYGGVTVRRHSIHGRVDTLWRCYC